MKWWMLAVLGLVGCAGEARKDTPLPLHLTTERVKEAWQKVEKPLEIEVVGRTQEELEAIGSLGVWFEGIKDREAQEFLFDGEVFKPRTPLLADSTVTPRVFYPFVPGLSPGDSIAVSHPIGPRLIGVNPIVNQTNDKIKVKIELNDITALLRIRLQSDNIGHMLDSLSITGTIIITEANLHPIGGTFSGMRGTPILVSTYHDCLLNINNIHDFHAIASEKDQDITIRVAIDGKEYSVSTTLPPLRKGSITELRLNFTKGKLSVGSSWVDTHIPFWKKKPTETEPVNVGDYLQRDGSTRKAANENSVAIVIATDGRHGTAVGLEDFEDTTLLSALNTGKVFESIDGTTSEGCFDAAYLRAKEPLVSWIPTVSYSAKCALSEANGIYLTATILDGLSEEEKREFRENALFPTAYLPSVVEMIHFAEFLSRNAKKCINSMDEPYGYYATCCESGENTFYAVDPILKRITGCNSKSYNDANLRLFYLF